jgi:hypothetical protein
MYSTLKLEKFAVIVINLCLVCLVLLIRFVFQMQVTAEKIKEIIPLNLLFSALFTFYLR